MCTIYEVKGFALVLEKVVLISPAFANEEKQFQFNVRFEGDNALKLRFDDRPQAILQRDLLIKALKEL